MRLSLRVLAHLLRYPDAALRAHFDDLLAALHDEAALDAARLHEITALVTQLREATPLHAEAAYVDLFDRGRATALHLFEHVHGDARERGPAMIDLGLTYARAGLDLAAGELPDYLPVVLEFASTQPAARAREFLREFAHLLAAIHAALARRRSAYAAVLAALLDLAGEPVQALPAPTSASEPEPTVDEAWEEPPAFGGCSSQGQARPGQPQPVHFVQNPNPARADSAQGARA
jgi:nitrate reductase delta subunit